MQDGLGQVLENQPFRRAYQRDLRGLLAGQAEHAQLDFVLARTQFQDLVGLRPGWEVPVRPFQDDVGSQPGEVRLGHTCGQLFLPFVEFVIAEHRQIVAHQVVDVDGAFAHQQLRDGRRGKVHVAGVEQCHVFLTDISPDVIDYIGDIGRAAATAVVGLQAAVKVVGVQ